MEHNSDATRHIAATFISAAEAGQILQAAAWLNALGLQSVHEPTMLGNLGAMCAIKGRQGRIDLVQIGSFQVAVDSAGVLDPKNTRLTCVDGGSLCTTQHSSLLDVLPPGVHCDGCITLSSSQWGIAVQQLQHRMAVEAAAGQQVAIQPSSEQVVAAMLHLWCLSQCYHLLLPLHQLLATHKHTISHLLPVIKALQAGNNNTSQPHNGNLWGLGGKAAQTEQLQQVIKQALPNIPRLDYSALLQQVVTTVNNIQPLAVQHLLKKAHAYAVHWRQQQQQQQPEVPIQQQQQGQQVQQQAGVVVKQEQQGQQPPSSKRSAVVAQQDSPAGTNPAGKRPRIHIGAAAEGAKAPTPVQQPPLQPSQKQTVAAQAAAQAALASPPVAMDVVIVGSTAPTAALGGTSLSGAINSLENDEIRAATDMRAESGFAQQQLNNTADPTPNSVPAEAKAASISALPAQRQHNDTPKVPLPATCQGTQPASAAVTAQTLHTSKPAAIGGQRQQQQQQTNTPSKDAVGAAGPGRKQQQQLRVAAGGPQHMQQPHVAAAAPEAAAKPAQTVAAAAALSSKKSERGDASSQRLRQARVAAATKSAPAQAATAAASSSQKAGADSARIHPLPVIATGTAGRLGSSQTVTPSIAISAPAGEPATGESPGAPAAVKTNAGGDRKAGSRQLTPIAGRPAAATAAAACSPVEADMTLTRESASAAVPAARAAQTRTAPGVTGVARTTLQQQTGVPPTSNKAGSQLLTTQPPALEATDEGTRQRRQQQIRDQQQQQQRQQSACTSTDAAICNGHVTAGTRTAAGVSSDNLLSRRSRGVLASSTIDPQYATEAVCDMSTSTSIEITAKIEFDKWPATATKVVTAAALKLHSMNQDGFTSVRVSELMGQLSYIPRELHDSAVGVAAYLRQRPSMFRLDYDPPDDPCIHLQEGFREALMQEFWPDLYVSNYKLALSKAAREKQLSGSIGVDFGIAAADLLPEELMPYRQLFPSFKQFAEAALTDEFAIAPRFTTYRLVPYDQLQQYYQQYVPQLVRHAGVARMLPQIADNLVAAMQQQVAGNKKRFIPRLRFGGVAKVLREQPRAIRANLQVDGFIQALMTETDLSDVFWVGNYTVVHGSSEDECHQKQVHYIEMRPDAAKKRGLKIARCSGWKKVYHTGGDVNNCYHGWMCYNGHLPAGDK